MHTLYHGVKWWHKHEKSVTKCDGFLFVGVVITYRLVGRQPYRRNTQFSYLSIPFIDHNLRMLRRDFPRSLYNHLFHHGYVGKNTHFGLASWGVCEHRRDNEYRSKDPFHVCQTPHHKHKEFLGRANGHHVDGF